MDFIVKVLIKAGEYGFKCFIDPHQDVVRIKDIKNITTIQYSIKIINDLVPPPPRFSGQDFPEARARRDGHLIL